MGKHAPRLLACRRSCGCTRSTASSQPEHSVGLKAEAVHLLPLAGATPDGLETTTSAPVYTHYKRVVPSGRHFGAPLFSGVNGPTIPALSSFRACGGRGHERLTDPTGCVRTPPRSWKHQRVHDTFLARPCSPMDPKLGQTVSRHPHPQVPVGPPGPQAPGEQGRTGPQSPQVLQAGKCAV